MSEDVDIGDFRDQIRRYGYYDSNDDPDWEEASWPDPAVTVAEHRWAPCQADWTPSRLWDGHWNVTSQMAIERRRRENLPATY